MRDPDQYEEGIIVKKVALCIALVASLTGTAQGALVEFERAVVSAAPIAGLSSRADLAATAASPATRPGEASELPEPEVFAMMLLGLVLIGYRARRHSDEKFE
jgi:hypothetical protein